MIVLNWEEEVDPKNWAVCHNFLELMGRLNILDLLAYFFILVLWNLNLLLLSMVDFAKFAIVEKDNFGGG